MSCRAVLSSSPLIFPLASEKRGGSGSRREGDTKHGEDLTLPPPLACQNRKTDQTQSKHGRVRAVWGDRRRRLRAYARSRARGGCHGAARTAAAPPDGAPAGSADTPAVTAVTAVTAAAAEAVAARVAAVESVRQTLPVAAADGSGGEDGNGRLRGDGGASGTTAKCWQLQTSTMMWEEGSWKKSCAGEQEGTEMNGKGRADHASHGGVEARGQRPGTERLSGRRNRHHQKGDTCEAKMHGGTQKGIGTKVLI